MAASDSIIDELVSKLERKVEVPDVYGYRPNDNQLEAHMCDSRGRVILGGNRSGKSYWSVVEMLLWALNIHPYLETPKPPLRLRHVAVDRPNGIDKILKDLYKQLCPEEELEGGSFEKAWKLEPPMLRFKNGTFIEFMSYEQDLDKHAGTSRHAIAFDEEPDPAIFDENMMRLVDTKGKWWIAQTPVEGISWVYMDMYEPIMEEGKKLPVEIFKFPTRENKYIDHEALDELTFRLSEDDKRVRTEGDFVALTGLIFPYSRQVHRIKYEYNSALPVYASMDHGMRNPTCWLWYQVDSDGNIFVFHEYYEAGRVVADHARAVKMWEKQNDIYPVYRVGDPSIQNGIPTANGISKQSVQSEYAHHGIYIALGNNDVDTGLNRVSFLLKPPDFETPRLFIDESCVNLDKEFRMYRWEDWANKKTSANKAPKAMPKKRDDHAMDALRYFCMSRPLNDSGNAEPNPDGFVRDSVGFSDSSTYAEGFYATDRDFSPPEAGSYYDTELGSDW